MNQKVFLLLLSSLLLLYSCSDTDIQKYSKDDFTAVVELSQKRKKTRKLLSIDDIIVKDSLLIVGNNRDSSIFMAFGINGNDTLNCIKSWGRKGRGPNEYGTFTHLIDLPQNKFYIADYSRLKIQKYTIPKFKPIENKKIINQRYEDQIKEIPQKIVFSSDDSLFFYDKFKKHELYITRWKNGNIPEEIYSFEDLKQEYEKAMTYWGCMAINEKLNRIVYAYNYFRRFDIMDFKGNKIKTVKIGPNSPSPLIKGNGNIDSNQSLMCYINAVATDSSFFLNYAGHTYNELKDKEMQANCYIEEYNWNGKPIKRYKMNKFISNFDILPDKKKPITFIGIDETHEHPILILKEKYKD